MFWATHTNNEGPPVNRIPKKRFSGKFLLASRVKFESAKEIRWHVRARSRMIPRMESEMAAFDRGIRPLLEIVLPNKAEAILSFQPAEKLQARIEELASKNNEGQLTKSERAEYAGYVRANKFIAILRRKARELAA
jgi:hypothetical protein